MDNDLRKAYIIFFMVLLLILFAFFIGYYVGKVENLRATEEFFRNFMKDYCLCWKNV